MTTKARWIGLSLGVLLILGAFGVALAQGGNLVSPGSALAQSAPTPTPAPSQGTTQPSTQTKPQLSQYLDAFWNALAKQFGLTVDQTKSKVTAAEKDVIEQMVTDGKITRAQADKLEQNLGNNPGFGPFFGKGRGFGGRGVAPNGPAPNGARPGMFFGFKDSAAELEAVAAALNMKPADLQAQLRSGKTLADVATAQKVDQAKVKQAIIDAEKAEIQREVQDGIITQAQADRMLANLTPDKIDLTRMPFGRGGGFH